MSALNRNRRILWAFVFVASWLLAIFVYFRGCDWFAAKMLNWFSVRSRHDAFEGVRKEISIQFLIVDTIWCAIGIAASLRNRIDVATILLIGPGWIAASLMIHDWNDPAWFTVLASSMIAWFVSIVVAVVWWRFHSRFHPSDVVSSP